MSVTLILLWSWLVMVIWCWHALLEQFPRVHGWERSLWLNSDSLWGLNRSKQRGLFVSLTPMVGNPLTAPLLVWLCLWWYGSESKDLLVQFTLAPLCSHIRVCIIHCLLKRAWIGATIVVLIRPSMWVIIKLVMDHWSLQELVTLQYGSFGTQSKQVKQLAQQTWCLKHPTEWAMKWQLYFNELDRSHLGWSWKLWQEWGLLHLE